MEVTPLELGLAAALVCIAFGPKKLPRAQKPAGPEETVDLSTLRASQHAAGRAPSPLSMHSATPAFVADEEYAIMKADWQYDQASKLPHEF